MKTLNTLRNIISSTKSTGIALLAIGLTFPSLADAGWNPLKKARDTAGRITNSVKTEVGRATSSTKAEAGRAAQSVKRAHRLNYRLSIQNNPRVSGLKWVYYTFEGKPTRVDGGMTHWGTKAGNPRISFDNGRGQTISYTLSRSGSYYFGQRNGVLDLFRAK